MIMEACVVDGKLMNQVVYRILLYNGVWRCFNSLIVRLCLCEFSVHQVIVIVVFLFFCAWSWLLFLH